ncbi:Kunitz-type trypsin inhibitor alpha chain [Linum perenne]
MMKTSNAMLLVVLISITLSSASAARSLAETLATSSLTPLPVLDVDGKVVRSGTTYYVLPATSGEGGGVALASMTSDPESCPLTVVQDEDEISQDDDGDGDISSCHLHQLAKATTAASPLQIQAT